MSNSVLVVENEPLVREALKDLLDLVGLRVIGARTGNEGVDTYRALHKEISLVILDMRLPGMNGADTLKALRAIDPSIKAIVSSGYEEDEVAQFFEAEPPTSILKKPYNADALLSKVRDAFARKY